MRHERLGPGARADRSTPRRARARRRRSHPQFVGRRADALHGCAPRAVPREHCSRTRGSSPARPAARRPAPRRTALRARRRARRQVDVEPAVPGERHLEQRREQAAVGAVVIGEQQACRAQLGDRREEAAQPLRIVEVRRARRPARRTPAPAPSRPADCGRARGRRATSEVVALACAAAGVSVRRTSVTGANAVTMSDTGAATLVALPPRATSCCIDSESLPTGMAIPSAGHSSIADGAHRFVQGARPRRVARGRHPVRRQPDLRQRAISAASDVGDRLADRQARRGRRVEQRHRRALAHRHRLAGVAIVIRERDRHVGDRDLPRSHHLIAADEPADGAIADRDQERLVGDRRQPQHAERRLAQVDRARCRTRRRCGAALRRRASSSAACRAARRSAGRRARRRTADRSTQQPAAVVDRRRPPRTDSARAPRCARRRADASGAIAST